MTYTSLHTIVTGLLLKKRYPMHFYIEFLVYCSEGLRELNFDTLGNVQTALLPINSYGAIAMPSDYMDWVKIGIPNGQYVIPLSNRSGISRLNNKDVNGNIIPFGDDLTYNRIGWAVHYNDNGEFTGRMYGNKGSNVNSFKEIKERGEIQINLDLDATQIVLEYISDGSCCDNATKINPYAIKTIETYALWQHDENSRSAGEGQKQVKRRAYDHEHHILRARLNSMTKADILSIINKNTHGSIK